MTSKYGTHNWTAAVLKAVVTQPCTLRSLLTHVRSWLKWLYREAHACKCGRNGTDEQINNHFTPAAHSTRKHMETYKNKAIKPNTHTKKSCNQMHRECRNGPLANIYMTDAHSCLFKTPKLSLTLKHPACSGKLWWPHGFVVSDSAEENERLCWLSFFLCLIAVFVTLYVPQTEFICDLCSS